MTINDRSAASEECHSVIATDKTDTNRQTNRREETRKKRCEGGGGGEAGHHDARFYNVVRNCRCVVSKGLAFCR